MEYLQVYYDAACPFCRACRNWLARQPAIVPLRFVASGSRQADMLLGHLPWYGRDLIVMDERGNFWVGPAAFVMCLWALEGTRTLAELLTWPILGSVARLFFSIVSDGRGLLSAFTREGPCEGACHAGAPSVPSPRSGPYRDGGLL